MRGKAVIVLGMSRTGTSAAARLLNLVGVDLGRPEQLIGPLEGQNPRGFYENRMIMLLNEELLRRLGGSWSHPPLLEPGWQSRPEFDELRDRARGLLAENFSRSTVWGFKDPRLSLTLPFWQELIGQMSCVVCHRNVLEVAGSLQRRDGLPIREAVAQWVRYCSSAIVNTAAMPRIFIGYEELVTDPERALADLAEFVGREAGGPDPTLLAAAREWIAPDLRHHTSELSEVMASRDVPPGARSLQLALDLAVHARQEEDALRGRATAGPISDALTALAGELASVPPAYRAQRPRRRSPAALPVPSRLDLDVDFVLIGAPEAVWRMADWLRRDPRIALDGETGAGSVRGLADARLSTGTAGRSIREIASDLAATSPHARIVAIVQDPIQRAIEHHRDAARRGLERRSLARALREQLCPGALSGARAAPSPTNGYIIWGECGAIVRDYLAVFPPAALTIVREEDPEAFVQVLSSVGLGAAEGSNRGPDAGRAVSEPLPAELEAALRTHFAADARLLEQLVGVRLPWRDSGAAAPGPAADTFSVSGGGVAEVEAVARRVSAALSCDRGLAVSCAPDTSYALLGFDPRTGAVRARSPLLELLRHRPLAAAGCAADAAFAAQEAIGLEITVAVQQLDPLRDAFIAIAAARGDYDAVLVSSPDSGTELCARLARELSVIAIDLGVAFERLLYPSDAAGSELAQRWAVDQYARELDEPSPPHRHEGGLVRERGTASVFYIERGRARKLTHRRMTELIGGQIAELEPDELASIPRGLPIEAVHDGRMGICLLIDGHRRPLDLGIPVRSVAPDALGRLPVEGPEFPWLP